MNKNLKKIIGIVLATNFISVLAPETGFSLINTKAYAESEITNFKIEDSDGDPIYIYNKSECKNDQRVDSDKLEVGNTYYTKKTSSDEIEISIAGVDSDCVRVFNKTSSSTKGKSIGSDIELASGMNTITVKTYSSDPGEVQYGDTNYTGEYKIKINYEGEDEDEDSDNVYLSTIFLSSGNINFQKRVSSYDVTVPEEINKITIRAKPDCDSDEYDNYKVKINGIKVDKDDKFKDDFSLDKGKNVIDIKVEDDEDNERIYTLNITRGKVTNSDNQNSGNASTSGKNNKWVQVNGKWQYNDGTGNAVKNMWVGNYYLQASGDMATGWLNYSGSWYYLGTDGAKKTGWQSIDRNWYYLDAQGKIKTGWFKDSDGKWYYLNSFGAMAYNTMVDGYRLGSDGRWSNS